MHVRLAELSQFLTARRAALLDAVDAVPPSRRDQRPAPDRWSAAEVLDHLATVESGVARLVGKLVTEGKARGLGEETSESSVLDDTLGFAFRDRSNPVDAPERVRPRADATAAEALPALERSRAQLREELRAASGFALGELTWHHPRAGTINLYQWLHFLGEHEARHTEQLREIARTFETTA